MIVDGHCDTLKEAFERNISLDNKKLKFNILEVKQPMIQMMATYISPEEANEGFEVAIKVLEKFKTEKEKFKDILVQINESKDIEKVKNSKIGIMLTTENGSVIQGNLDNIDKLYDEGIRMMSIVWNESNELASGALEEKDNGLTDMGKRFIKKLNEKNIIIDISHASEKTFWDTIKISSKPVVASHSNVYNLCKYKRNLKDEQIKQIAKMGGIIGIVFGSSFLTERKSADVSDIVRHIKYIKNLVGIDYVGFGSDFDGLNEEHVLEDIKGIKDIDKIILELRNEGFTINEIDKVLGENWIRVIKENI